MLATIQIPSLWEIFGPALKNPETYRPFIAVMQVAAPVLVMAIAAMILLRLWGGLLNLFVPQRPTSRRRRR